MRRNKCDFYKNIGKNCEFKNINSYVTPTPELRDTWGGPAGNIMWSNVKICS